VAHHSQPGPADLRKEGPGYDLPMAVALLAASEQLALDPARNLFLGELDLDGTLRHTTGILPMPSTVQAQAGVHTPKARAPVPAFVVC
jgi:magnesium chelatase family protein